MKDEDKRNIELQKIRQERIFLIVEFVLYISFILIDVNRGFNVKSNKIISISKHLKFLSVLICLLFVFLPYKSNTNNILKYDHIIYDPKDLHLLRLGLLFTAISDILLLYTNYTIFGLLTFITVQISYMTRIHRWKTRSDRRVTPMYVYLIRNIIITAIIFILLSLIVVIINQDKSRSQDIIFGFNQETSLKITVVLALFYFTSLVLNFIDSLKVARANHSFQARIFTIGLLLFILCDINVGLYNLHHLIPLNTTIHAISQVAMWLFYLPSQVLIALSKNSR